MECNSQSVLQCDNTVSGELNLWVSSDAKGATIQCLECCGVTWGGGARGDATPPLIPGLTALYTPRTEPFGYKVKGACVQ